MDADTKAWMTRALNAEHAVSRMTRNLFALCEHITRAGAGCPPDVTAAARTCIDNPSGALIDGERTPVVDRLAERDQLAAQLAEAEVGAAVMRAVLGTHARHWTTCPSYPRTAVAGTIQGACDCGLADALATGAGKRLLDLVRGLPEWVDEWLFTPREGGSTPRLCEMESALREHLRAAGIETGGAR